MNTYYESRLIKLVSPLTDEVFTLELGGDEKELKELISTILNIPSSSLKGLRDSYGTYYTFSSAIRNPHLTSEYSSFYFIVVSNFSTAQQSPPQIKSPSPKFGSKMNFNNEVQGGYRPTTSNPLIQMSVISPIRKPKNLPSQSVDGSLINNQVVNNDIFTQIADKMFEDKMLNEKEYTKLKQFINDENDEVITLLNLYLKHGKDLKKLYAQLSPIIKNAKKNDILSSSPRETSKKGQVDQSTLVGILDSFEDQFDNKNDVNLLRRLLMCDNEQIMKVLENYEYDNDQKKLMSSLEELLQKYRSRFSQPSNNFNPQTTILDIKANDSPKETKPKSDNEGKQIEKIKKRLKKYLTANQSQIRFDYILYFNYEIEVLSLEQKEDLFTNTFGISKTNTQITQKTLDAFKAYYNKLINKKVLNGFKGDEIDMYQSLLDEEDEGLVELYNDLELSKDLNSFKEKLHNYLAGVIEQRMQQEEEEKESKGGEEEEEEEEEEGEGEEEESIEADDSEAESSEDEDESNSNEYIINNRKNQQKEKVTQVLNGNKNKKTESNHSISLVPGKSSKKYKDNDDFKLTLINKQDDTKSTHSTSQNTNKKMNEFIKVINSMSFSESNKRQILDLLSNKNEKMIKIFDNFQKNKLSLTKKVLLQALSGDNSNKNNSKKQPPSSKSDKSKGKPDQSKNSFEGFVTKKMTSGEIDKKTCKFLIKKFEEKDDLLCSIYEVFCQDEDEEDFWGSIGLFLKKYGNQIKSEDSSSDNRTPNSISSYKKDLVTYLKGRERGEIKNKQKTIIDLLIKEGFLPSDWAAFFYPLIDSQDKRIVAAFEVFGVTLNHLDFAETLSIIRSEGENESGGKDDDNSKSDNEEGYGPLLKKLLKDGDFSDKEKEVANKEFKKENSMLMAILESYEPDDEEDTIDTLHALIEKALHKN